MSRLPATRPSPPTPELKRAADDFKAALRTCSLSQKRPFNG